MTGNTGGVRATSGCRRYAPVLGLLLVVSIALTTGTQVAWAGPLDDAQAAAERGDWSKAADHYVEALKSRTTMRAAAVGLTEAAVKAKRTDLFAAAEDALFTLRDRHKRDWGVHVAMGEISLAIGATKTDSLALKSYHAEALRSFKTAYAGDPRSEPAAAGVARTLFEGGDFEGAVGIVDSFLGRRPDTTARALFWKGQALYFLARDAHGKAGGSYPLPQQVEGLFRKAQGAYHSSVRGDATSYEAWMQYAYASQYLNDRTAATEGYTRALALDPESVYPLRGIEALNKHDPSALTAALKAIVDQHPKHAQGLFFLGYNRLAASDWAGAIEMFKRYVAVAKAPAEGSYWLGKAYESQGDGAKAAKAFEETLRAAPDHLQAAWALDQRLIRAGARQKAAGSFKGAQEVIASYRSLLKLAPRNAFVRNNLAFTLREAYGAHQGSKKWLPILKAATQFYVEASDILGEWTPEKDRTLDWAQRYAQAQVISDTGLMYQFYEQTRDLKKAEMYYDRALDYTDAGYRDAFNNLAQILNAQQRWQDLYDLAAACSEGLRTEADQPDEAARAAALKIMQKLQADGKVED